MSAMTMRRNNVIEGRPLEYLGIGEQEERVYRWLLAHRGASAAETARALMLAPAKAQRLLAAIEGKGLATHSPQRPRRYMSLAPDVALEALILRREENLKQARILARELRDEVVADRRGAGEQVVEVITARRAESQMLGQIVNSAQREVAALVRPPVRVLRLDVPTERGHSDQRKSQTRGVRHRSVVSEDFLDLEGAVQSIRSDMRAGEEVRVARCLPLKMVLADRRVALIPLDSRRPDSPSLLIRSSDLLDSLYALFELLWDKAAPISFTRTDAQRSGTDASRLGEDIEALISLMATGLNDKTIAYDLHIPKRTFTRRTSEMMRALSARTRFQAGWLAALSLLRGEFAAPLESAKLPDRKRASRRRRP